MKIIINKRKKTEKNLTKINKIPAIIYTKQNHILIKINKNNYYYNIFKKNIYLSIILINIIYKVKVKNLQYHPYKKLILHIEFVEIFTNLY